MSSVRETIFFIFTYLTPGISPADDCTWLPPPILSLQPPSGWRPDWEEMPSWGSAFTFNIALTPLWGLPDPAFFHQIRSFRFGPDFFPSLWVTLKEIIWYKRGLSYPIVIPTGFRTTGMTVPIIYHLPPMFLPWAPVDVLHNFLYSKDCTYPLTRGECVLFIFMRSCGINLVQ